MLRFAFTSLALVVAATLIFSMGLNSRLALPVAWPVVSIPAPRPVVRETATGAAVNRDSLDTIAIAPDRAGNYQTNIDINGQTIRVYVDTGASYLSLTAEDANALGFNLAPEDFRYRTSTANGRSAVAKVHIDAVHIANFEIDDVDALVSQPGALPQSLLGMNVLSRLGSVHISDGQLVLQR